MCLVHKVLVKLLHVPTVHKQPFCGRCRPGGCSAGSLLFHYYTLPGSLPLQPGEPWEGSAKVLASYEGVVSSSPMKARSRLCLTRLSQLCLCVCFLPQTLLYPALLKQTQWPKNCCSLLINTKFVAVCCDRNSHQLHCGLSLRSSKLRMCVINKLPF